MDMLTEALERLFREKATPAMIRAVETGDTGSELWTEIAESGFLDMLLPEEKGGAEVSLSDAFGAFMLAGRHALPFPFVQTVMARGWLDALGYEAPEGAIAIAGPETRRTDDGVLSAQGVAFGKVADWVLAGFADSWVLLPVAAAQIQGDEAYGSQSADFSWNALPEAALVIPVPADSACSPAQLAAASLAPLLAGAASQALDMTLTHVAERQQFGRAIAQFQAVQNQISVMAERVWAMRMAARLALQASGAVPTPRLVAIGKARCSEAAVTVADTAHALHGAIGITEEYDLQLYTRRLREWRRAGGTEALWARNLGREVIGSGHETVLDFILESTQ